MQANAPQSRRIRLNFIQSSGCLTFVGIIADATAKHGSDWRILSLDRYQEPLSAKIVSLRKLLLTYESTLLDRFFDLWKKILKIVPHNVYHYQSTNQPAGIYLKALVLRSRGMYFVLPPNLKMAPVAFTFVVRFSTEVRWTTTLLLQIFSLFFPHNDCNASFLIGCNL